MDIRTVPQNPNALPEPPFRKKRTARLVTAIVLSIFCVLSTTLALLCHYTQYLVSPELFYHCSEEMDPTGIVVACQTQRDQFQNKETCMRMLRSKLIEIKEREHLDKISDIKGTQLKIEWGSQIRNYVFMPYTLVKDTRTGFETSNINAVMDGDLDGFINAYLTCAATNTWVTKS